MGKVVQVKSGYSAVALPPLGLPLDAGQSKTLTDAEYAGLSSPTLNAVTVIQSGVADPVRSGNYNPLNLADAVQMAVDAVALTERAVSGATTVAAQEFIVADATTTGYTVTGPTPAAGVRRWAVKRLDTSTNLTSTNVITVSYVNYAGATVTVPLTLAGETRVFRAGGSGFRTESSDTPKTEMDKQYAPSVTAAGLDYTGATDSTAAFQAILNAASALAVAAGSFAVATVATLPGKLKLTGLTVPTQVLWRGQATRVDAGGSGTVVTCTGSHSGIEQVEFQGGGAAVGANGVVFSATAFHGYLGDVRFNNFSGRAVLFSSGSLGCSLTEMFAQNCLLSYSGLAAKTGVLEINGTDHHVYGNVEVTASVSGGLTSVNAYVCAVVVAGAAHFLERILAEVSDVGFYINGCSDLKMIACRADLNQGNGFEFVNGGNGSIVGCEALRNSRATDNTYDGFFASAGNFQFIGCQANSSSGGGFTHKYGFEDTQNSDAGKNFYIGCYSAGHTTATFKTANFAGAAVTIPDHPRVTLSATGATPNVDNKSQIALSNSSTQLITGFANGVSGQTITLYGDGQSTLQHNGAGIITRSGLNILLASNVSIQLNLQNGTWREVGGSYESAGTAVLVAGTKAVADTKITNNSKIRLTNMGAAGTLGVLSVAITAGTGFTINSSSATDTSSIWWEIIQY